MKRLILLLVLFGCCTSLASAQSSTPPGPRRVDSIPGTPCRERDFVQLKDSPYTTSLCKGGAWATVGTGSSVGSVTSVAAAGGAETVSGSAITTTGTIRGVQLVDAQTGTSYTIPDGSRYKLITFSNGSAVAASIAQAGTAGNFPEGWKAHVKNLGAGTVTITPAVSTIGGGATLVLTTGDEATITSNGTNYLVSERGVSDASRTILANTSGTNTGDQDLSSKENVANKSTDTALGTSDTLYPSQNAVQSYVNSAVATVAGNVPQLSGLASGGGVIWESAYTFRVAAATYYIAGVQYSSTEQTITLDAAHATLDRIDVLALDTTGTLVKITGTAAAQPSEPDYDPSTQLKLTFVFVGANTTAPAGVSNENIYLENTEWTSSTSGTGWNANSTTNPRTGTKDIEGTNVANNAYVQLQRGSSSTLDTFGTLSMFIRSKATWNNNRVLRVQFFLSGVAKGTAITVADGYWGFDSSITASYQLLSIPMNQFAIPAGTLVNQLRITDSGGAIGLYIDDIVLQALGTSISPPAATGITQTQGDARYAQRANNLSDLNSAATARTNLGATTVGGNLLTATNPSAISFPKVAADNTVSFRTPAQVLTDIGAEAAGAARPTTDTYREMGHLVRYNSSTIDAIGIATAGVAFDNVTSVADADGNWRKLDTAASANADAYYSTNGVVARRDWSPQFVVRMKTGSDITSSRIFVGVSSNGPTAFGASSPAAHTALFRYDTGADGTAFWRCLTNDNTTATVTTTTQSIAASTVYDMKIIMSASDVKFYINEALVATHTTTLPGSTTMLELIEGVRTLAASVRSHYWTKTVIRYK